MLSWPLWICLLLFSCLLQLYLQGYYCSALRQKRNILQLFEMVLKGTDKDPLDFIDYGCYCGYGGHGTPVDDIDRCCEAHDRCYDKVEVDCNRLLQDPKVNSYDWKSGDTIQCNNDEGTCKYMTCMCDRALSQCFNKFTAHPEVANKNKNC